MTLFYQDPAFFFRDDWTKQHLTEARAEEMILTSNNPGNQSLSTARNQSTETKPEPEHQTPFRSEGSLSREVGCWSHSYHEWPNSKALQLTLVPFQWFCLPAGFPEPRQSLFEPWIGRQIWTLPLLFLLVDFTIGIFFLKASATVLASMCTGQRALAL